jgi:poly-beta-1,6-N-acetyl-D-glucosamine synthase
MLEEMKYIIITPARDEENNIEITIQSVISQTIKPIEWLIINDGSTDNTGQIIDRYAEQFEWIMPLHRQNRGFRKAGTGVVEAFYEAYNNVSHNEWDFIVKMDGDLKFNADYFEKCFNHFKENSKLGIGGGIIYNDFDGVLKLEKTPLFHVRGATKIYKKKCWKDIGGLIKAPGWDTVDEVKANMLGWETKSFEELKIVHLKPTGSADGSWQDAVKGGTANYIAGYHPLFMLVRCIRRMVHKPYFIMPIGLFFGFVKGYIKKTPRVDDNKLIRYLRKEQLKRLFYRKTIWR